jgi:ABC-type nickel/cobalt efflux system permease component RcnA
VSAHPYRRSGGRRLGRLAVLVAVAAGLLAGWAGVGDAHPLGNFTVNTYSGLVVRPDSISVDFVVDMAEIPAYQTRQDTGIGDGPADGAPAVQFRSQECDQVAGHISVQAGARALPLHVVSTSLSFPPGQAGLSTLRLTCSLLSGSTGQLDRVTYRSDNFTDRVGWREITAAGDRMRLVGSDAPTASVSARLTRYPANLLTSPLDQRQTSFTVQPGGPPLQAGSATTAAPSSPLPRGVDQATQAFTSFVGRHRFSAAFALVAVALSLLLGAVHALAPGHGKTVMAAYLVGQRGSFRQAAVIALTVTLTHTAGVLALGLAISASLIVAPERLYPWLGLASGVMLAAIGLGVLARSLRLRRRRAAPHAAGQAHPHAGEMHTHGGRPHRHGPLGDGQPVTWGSLLAMGFVGGFLPSPSAVVVLLGAIALGRAWFGAVLVLAYGAGMAATLTGAGLLVLHARDALDRRLVRLRSSRLAGMAGRLVPVGTAVVIVGVGAYLSLRGLAQI